MKKLFYFFLMLAIAAPLGAQTHSQRLVLIEEFSGAW